VEGTRKLAHPMMVEETTKKNTKATGSEVHRRYEMGRKSRASTWTVLGAHIVSAIAGALQSRSTSHWNGSGEACAILAWGPSASSFFPRFHTHQPERESCLYATPRSSWSIEICRRVDELALACSKECCPSPTLRSKPGNRFAVRTYAITMSSSLQFDLLPKQYCGAAKATPVVQFSRADSTGQ
jgi:hypothetical protein